jgi:hypothetical protein
MSNRRRVVERNAGAFLGSTIAPIPAPANALYDGPGQPGPGDEWHMRTEPIDEIAGEDEVSLEAVQSDGTVILPFRPPHRV